MNTQYSTTKVYQDEELLPLSGIQHFCFCERQWALIHVEQQWSENILTIEGKQLHERVDDPYFAETRKDLRVVRSMPLVSRKLGLVGVADVVEFERDRPENTRIIEYKRGRPKHDDIDEVQLCAQAMCLEEMLEIELSKGSFFYGQTRHRVIIDLHEGLRSRVYALSQRMHELFEAGITPLPPKERRRCRNCSLLDLCLPVIGKKAGRASKVLKDYVAELEKST